MNITAKIAKIANRTDRFLGTTVNKLKDIALRGSQALPEIQRDIKYRLKFVTYQIRLNKIRPNTLAALDYANRGIQIGLVQRVLTTDFWFIDDLRKELADQEVHIVDIDHILHFANTPADLGTGLDQLRYDEAEIDYPIYINREMVIVDGNHRYLKAKEKGEKTIAVQYVGKPHLSLFNCDL